MSDSISRQAAVRTICDAYEGWPTKEEAETCRGIVAAIKALPSAEPRWIPCSERLPENDGRYLCTNALWGVYVVIMNAWINGEWLYPKENPVAWMPLPEAYEGGDGHGEV